MKGEFFMRRIEMFQNDDKSFNADFFASVISSWLNEEIEIKKAPEGSKCSNCFWHKIDEYNMITCKAPTYYIGMQLCDCPQYKPE